MKENKKDQRSLQHSRFPPNQIPITVVPDVRITPWRYTKIFGWRWGYTPAGLHMKIVRMHFYAQNAVL